MLRIALTILQVFSSIAIIALVLLQRGKGADAGAGFGAGASGTVFGARGARTALSRATAVFAAIFMINSLALAYMGSQQAAEQPKSILDEAAAESAPAPAPASGDAQSLPSAPLPAGQTPPAPASGGTPQSPTPN
jgi:preprotein translocase subunit SecG